MADQFRGKILIIDDDPIVVETIDILFDTEITVLSATNGKAGIAIAAAENPDLILLDVGMPDLDGYETCLALKAQSETANIPVIFLTGKKQSTDEAKGLEMGAIDYITKPIVPQIVRARVKNHLDQKRQRDELENLSTIDALTGIANRRRLNEYLENEWRRAVRNKYAVSLMMIDIDYFKQYNDTYGHQSGDSCLQKVANKIASAPRRPSDLVARYGGEEFCIVLPDTKSDSALEIAERIRENVAAMEIEHKTAPETGHITISIGIATAKPSAEDNGYENLLEIADKHLYNAKESGRNKVSDH